MPVGRDAADPSSVSSTDIRHQVRACRNRDRGTARPRRELPYSLLERQSEVAVFLHAGKDASVDRPVTRYAVSDGVNIAYQVVGTGPFDLVYVPGWVSNVEMMWEEPRLAAFLERLASFARLIVFDKRGTGLSDPVSDAELPGLERRMDDVRPVMDAAGSERAALLDHSEGGNMCILFSATFPERTSALVLVGC